MSRKFIATILAASIAVTGFSVAPARADSDDLVKFLAGATALVIIGKAIEDNKDDRRKKYERDNRRHKHDDNVSRRRDRDYDARPLPRRVHRKVLPSDCLRRVRTWNGNRRTFLGNRCLKNEYRHYSSLPERCFRKIETERGKIRRGYGVKCLRKRGYSLAQY